MTNHMGNSYGNPMMMGSQMGGQMIEHFTDTGHQRENFTQQGGENILRLILWLLISLFAIQLVELILKLIVI